MESFHLRATEDPILYGIVILLVTLVAIRAIMTVYTVVDLVQTPPIGVQVQGGQASLPANVQVCSSIYCQLVKVSAVEY